MRGTRGMRGMRGLRRMRGYGARLWGAMMLGVNSK